MFDLWSDALPYALRVGQQLARKFPLRLDVDSVVMEALWRAQVAGNTFSRAYVCQRVRGALIDEARRMAEGERGNYQDVGRFADIDHAFDLAGDVPDPVDAIDRKRLLDAMPPAARMLVNHVANGESFAEMATRFRVSEPRMSQVLADLKERPLRPRQLPGHMDLKVELARFTRQELRRRIGSDTNITRIAAVLGVCRHTAYQWSHGSAVNIRGGGLKPNPFRSAVRGRALEIVGRAFRRTNGEWVAAAELLSVSPMTAYRWGKLLPPGMMPDRSNRRPDIPTERFAELRAKGLSNYAIAKSLGVSKRTVYCRIGRPIVIDRKGGARQ